MWIFNIAPGTVFIPGESVNLPITEQCTNIELPFFYILIWMRIVGTDKNKHRTFQTESHTGGVHRPLQVLC